MKESLAKERKHKRKRSRSWNSEKISTIIIHKNLGGKITLSFSRIITYLPIDKRTLQNIFSWKFFSGWSRNVSEIFRLSRKTTSPNDQNTTRKRENSKEKTYLIWIYTLKNKYSKCLFHRTFRANESTRKKDWFYTRSSSVKFLYTGTCSSNIRSCVIGWMSEYRKISYSRYGVKSRGENNTAYWTISQQLYRSKWTYSWSHSTTPSELGSYGNSKCMSNPLSWSVL